MANKPLRQAKGHLLRLSDSFRFNIAELAMTFALYKNPQLESNSGLTMTSSGSQLVFLLPLSWSF